MEKKLIEKLEALTTHREEERARLDQNIENGDQKRCADNIQELINTNACIALVQEILAK